VPNGGDGNDVLVGLGDADIFAFTTAPGASNVDTIADFQAGGDRITLDHGVFAALTAGALDPNAFFAGTAAHDADDRIIYDSTTGNLFFDADGNGAGGNPVRQPQRSPGDRRSGFPGDLSSRGRSGQGDDRILYLFTA
jgi:Ca2+-binding RTX toxin-like protein